MNNNYLASGMGVRLEDRKQTIRMMLLAGASFAIAMTPQIAFAQDRAAPAASVGQPVAQADPGKSAVIEDIVVTAQKQRSSVQRTPLAVTAVGGEALKGRGIVSLESLTKGIPNTSFSRRGSDASIFIRGVGLDSAVSGVDGRVAVYTDEVVNARPQAALGSLYDVQRIEVLRGPQGTLYGRNATAGAINIISNDPTDHLEGYGTLTVGNYNLIRTEGAVSGPLAENVTARLSFQTNDHDGYGKNISNDQPINDERNRAVRAKVFFKPSAVFSLMLAADYRWEKDHQGGFSFVRQSPGFVPPAITAGFHPATGFQDRAGLGPDFFQENYGTSAIAKLILGKVELTSITAYRHLDQKNDTSLDLTTANNAFQYAVSWSDQISQELRASGKFGSVDLVVGGYYFHERNHFDQRAALAGSYLGIPTTTIFEGVAQGGTQRTDAYAAFAQATFHITDQLGLDVGGRYSYEKRFMVQFFQTDFTRPFEVDNQPLSGCAGPLACRLVLPQDAAWSSFDPKFSLHYQISRDALAYLTYGRGFKSGGFDFGSLLPAFSPEKITDYEGGIKADLLDRKLRLNLAGFYYDYSNLQVNVIQGLALVTKNAAKARIYGAEAEITAKPTADAHLSLVASWLHSEYLQYADVNPVTGVNTNLAGNQLTQAPKHKVVGEAGYTFHPGFGDLTPRVELSWTDRVQFSQFNVAYQDQAPRWELNLFLGLVTKNDWSFSAYMRNATDKKYYISGSLGPSFLGYEIVGNPAPPRTFGLAVTKHF